MEVWRAILQGLDAVIVNPSVILGPGDWKTGSSQLFSTVWKGLRFYTKGGTGFVDVKDVVSAMQRLMNDDVWEGVKNKRYILSAGNIAYREIFDKISYCFNLKRPKFFASDTILEFAWRLSALKSFLTGSRPSITRETGKSANKLSYYDGTKICRTIGFEYISVEDSIRNNARLFLIDFSL